MPKISNSLDHIYMSRLKTNFGWMRAISNGASLIRLEWNQTGWEGPDRPDYVSRETTYQLQAFFAGYLKQFDLPLAPVGKNANGRYWLKILAKIPYGTLMSYAEFAHFAGKPRAARAAGSVCASNPIPIIYPCHRVIRTDGKLGNYGGGSDHHSTHSISLERKAALIKLELC